MNIDQFQDLFNIGLYPLPIEWDTATKTAKQHPNHKEDITTDDGKHTIHNVIEWLKRMPNANGIAFKMHGPFFMFDFDLKNTKDKTIFDEWLKIVNAESESSLGKVCIERTRNGGYHVYAKHPSAVNKKRLAATASGAEVISIYTGGLLSYCSPTPGYEVIHNSFVDIAELTDKEFDVMTMAAMHFDKLPASELDRVYPTGFKTLYPLEYESMALQFDKNQTTESFEEILNGLGLHLVTDNAGGKRNFKKRKNKVYYLYKREGSTAEYSALVSFDNYVCLIFSGSYVNYPNFHNRLNEHDHEWIMTPTKLLYYKNKRDWLRTFEEIEKLTGNHNIEVVKSPPITEQPLRDNTVFPYDIFPTMIQDFIRPQVIQHEYLAAAILVAFSTVIGNTVTLEAMPGYMIKPILYMAIVAPPGASKTPAINKAFRPLEDLDDRTYNAHEKALKNFDEAAAQYDKNKNATEKPRKPNLEQILIKDSTIEMVAKIISHNTKGCCVVADELSGFINRMNQYKAGDEIQKWLELWAGSPLLIQRMTRDENKIPDPFCSVIGGIQPGVMDIMSREENKHNGFYHRFLFVYPEPQDKPEWRRVDIPANITEGFRDSFFELNKFRLNGKDKNIYTLSEEAEGLYKQWFDNKNKKYNRASSEDVKGIISKYQDYCLRLALVIQVMEDGPYRPEIILPGSMERAIRLTEYFFSNMNKALRLISPETPADNLVSPWSEFYEKLPPQFSARVSVELGKSLGISEQRIKNFLMRHQKTLVTKLQRGTYEKLL